MLDNQEGKSFLIKKRELGIQRLEAFLLTNCSEKPIRLNERQLLKYKKRNFIAGWAIQPPNISRRIIICVDSRYPFSIPKVALDPPPQNFEYPHIEEDGYLCISELAVPKDENKLEDVAEHIIQEAIDLIERCFSGKNKDDFKDGIITYWDRMASDDSYKYYSILDLKNEGCSKKIKVWKNIENKDISLVADTHQNGLKWLNQKQNKTGDKTSDDALLVFAKKTLNPDEYPRTNKQLHSFLTNHCDKGAIEKFNALAGRCPKTIDIIIKFNTRVGSALVGISLEKPKNKKKLIKGFRDGNLPPQIAGTRYACQKTFIKRFSVQRVDPIWVLSRDSDQRISLLSDKLVTIVGCGAIGSEVARMLAQNGVANFNLVDPDIMKWENIGRHLLTATSIDLGRYLGKAQVLNHILKLQFPHITIHASHAKRWEDTVIESPEMLNNSDLIIMATGDWTADNAINQYGAEQQKFPPILYGWAEAYAVAGHSFAVIKNGACFNCAFNDTNFNFNITKFKKELMELPTCGGVFQPFRSIELAHINALIASHAIDIILSKPKKSQIKSWVGAQKDLIRNDGEWTDFAKKEIKNNGNKSGQFIVHTDLEKNTNCSIFRL